MAEVPSTGPEETLDRITRDWQIFQLARGHRFSTDDSVTAWTAGRARPDARRLLDMGAGIGSVGLMTLHQMQPKATMVMVEVQQISHELAKKTIAFNALEERITLRHGDLRDPDSVPEEGVFDLITGSPPYFPVGTAVMSPNPQRAGARMELKGDVYDYCRTAVRALAPDGTFVFCHAAGDTRPEDAIVESGLTLNCRQDVTFRAGRAPTIAVFTASFTGERIDAPELVMRDAEGVLSDDWRRVRRAMGLPEIP